MNNIIFTTLSFQIYLNYSHFLVTLVVPSFMIVAINFRIMKSILKSGEQVSTTEQEHQQEHLDQERCLTNYYLSLTLIFVMSNIPKLITSLYEITASEEKEVYLLCFCLFLSFYVCHNFQNMQKHHDQKIILILEI